MNESPKHIIFDFETTSNKPTSAVASVAVIVFDPSELKTFDELVANALRLKFDLKEQFKLGRTYDADTINWWKHPDQAEAYEKVIKPSPIDVSIRHFGAMLEEYLIQQRYQANVGEKIWTRGNEFDPPILKNLAEQFGFELPYPWWNIRDVRTEIDAITPYWNPDHDGWGYVKEFPYPEGFIKHKEEHDCARDILMMQYTHIKMIQHLESLGS